MLYGLIADSHFRERTSDAGELGVAWASDPAIPVDLQADDPSRSGEIWQDDPSVSSNGSSSGTGQGSGGLVTDLVVDSDWGAGFCATLWVTNETAADITWQATVDIGGTIDSYGNCEVTEQAVGVYLFEGIGWNSVIAPGQAWDVGFCATR